MLARLGVLGTVAPISTHQQYREHNALDSSGMAFVLLSTVCTGWYRILHIDTAV